MRDRGLRDVAVKEDPSKLSKAARGELDSAVYGEAQEVPGPYVFLSSEESRV